MYATTWSQQKPPAEVGKIVFGSIGEKVLPPSAEIASRSLVVTRTTLPSVATLDSPPSVLSHPGTAELRMLRFLATAMSPIGASPAAVLPGSDVSVGGGAGSGAL